MDVQFHEFPSDLIITPHFESGCKGAVYMVTSNDKLNEALLLLLDAKDKQRSDFRIIAIMEDVDMKTISVEIFRGRRIDSFQCRFIEEMSRPQ